MYLLVLPFSINCIAKTNFIKNTFSEKTNAMLNYKEIKVQTHFLPYVSIKTSELNITSKENEKAFIISENFQGKLSILPLILRQIEIKNVVSDKLIINLDKDQNGVFNFEKIFPKNDKKNLKLSLKNSNIKLENLKINLEDKELNKVASINATPIIFNTDAKKKEFSLTLNGKLTTKDSKDSDFDINIKSQYPFKKELGANLINGDFIAYNIDLDLLKPYIQKYLDKGTAKLGGIIEFIQFSAEKNKSGQNQIIANTTFKNVTYDRQGWKNYVIANGTNKIDTKIELEKNKIKINSLKYTAEKINAKADGEILFKDKPVLDINVEIIKSRAENIASILPPNTVPTSMILERVKKYGVYGDVNGNIKIQGKVPQPNILGYVKGRNVHILDKSTHDTHKGRVDIKFDNRILNMDILVNLKDNQNAKITGYTYIFRDGINNINIKTTDNIDFPLAQKIIVPISDVFRFQLGPIPEMDITSGNGIIDLNIQSRLDYVKLDGYSVFDNAELTYNGLYGKIEKGKGRLDFNEDTISFKSEKAFVNDNPISIEGKVKINNNLDFNISSNLVKANDALEIINKSDLLKEIKNGLAIIKEASGPLRLFVNIKSKIKSAGYGQPPLPPEEAFQDMRTKGSVYLLGNTCKIEGFYTPIKEIKGIVDFTELHTNLNEIHGVSGTSPITLNGKILNDQETKIPDIDIIVESNSVNLKDTIKFLTESYMYPKDYPDISSLYKIASKHDLYFTYKAKSVDFVTNNAYAVMNFIPDNTDSSLKATSGKVIMDKSTIYVQDVNAKLFDSNVKINGQVNNIDKTIPEYNLKIDTKNFNLTNLNNTSKLECLPNQMKLFINKFKNISGFTDINMVLNKNLLEGKINFKNLYAEHIQSKVPFVFDNFIVNFKNNRMYINDLTAQIGDIPIYGNITTTNLDRNSKINGFFTSKITNLFIKNYMPASISNKFEAKGDINLSAKFNGEIDNFNIQPKLTFNVGSDIIFDGTNLGEIGDIREFNGIINFTKDKINIKKFDYIKHIESHNNKTFPVLFASLNGTLNIEGDNKIVPNEINIKTNKNISARVLNVFFKEQILKQGTFNGDVKYTTDKITGLGKLLGNIECKNIDIPLFETVVKNIEINGTKNDINIQLFGFMSDSKINIASTLDNNLGIKPKIKSLNIYAEQIDNNKLLSHLSKTHKAMNTNNNIKNMDLSGLSIENGTLDIGKITIKSLVANNFKTNFYIDKKGIFHANNTQVNVGEGDILGDISFNLETTEMKGDFELTNVDANYVAETLFDGKNQIYGSANGKIFLETKGLENKEILENLSGYVYFDISDGKMPKLGSLEYLLRASNIVKSGITGFSLNNILELLNLVKTGYFSNINGGCSIENGIAKNIEIFSKGENLSLYIHGNYDIANTHAEMEILGKLSKRISTIFGAIGNTSLNTFFKLIPGISMIDYSRENFIQDVEKIPSFTNGQYEAKTFQAIIDGNINESGYVQSFKWVE